VLGQPYGCQENKKESHSEIPGENKIKRKFMETNFRIVAGSFYFKKQAEWGPCMYDSESYKTRQTYSNNLFHAELIWRNQGIAFIVFSLTA